MSYFIFGSIKYQNGLSENEISDLSWKIIKESLKNRLFILLGFNVKVEIVKSMLKEQDPEIDKSLRFLITESPIEDTSDSLLSPFDPKTSFLDLLNQKFLLLETFLKDILEIQNILSIRVYITEGHDNNFIKKEVEIKNFAALLLIETKDSIYDIPSISILLKK